MVISTGDELVEPGDPSSPASCAAPMRMPLAAAFAGAVSARRRRAPARPTRGAARAPGAHLDTHEVLVLSGGVSMGKFDLVPAVLPNRRGDGLPPDRAASRQAHVVRHLAGGRAVFGLPGNPVSTLVCLLRYVLPGLLRGDAARARDAAEKFALGDPSSSAPSHRLRPPCAWSLTEPATVGAAVPHARLGGLRVARRHPGFIELPPGPRFSYGVSSPRSTAGSPWATMAGPEVLFPAGPEPGRATAGPTAARPAHLGDGPLQLPLPLLHAARALPRALPLPEVGGAAVLRGDHARRAPSPRSA